MNLRRLIATVPLLAPAALAGCVFHASGSSAPHYTVFHAEGKVFRVNNRTGEVWEYGEQGWKSLGGAMHEEGRSEPRKHDEEEDEDGEENR